MRTHISRYATGAALVAFLAVALGHTGSLGAEPTTRPSRPHALTAVGTTLFFFANDGVHGDELWRSDGSRGGTRMVADLRPGAGPRRADVWETAVLGREIYFTVDDGVHGLELWRSDGTEAGTRLVRDIRAGAVGSNPYDLSVVDGVLLFTADDGVHGREPWRSDGTQAGTRLLKDVRPGEHGSDADALTVVGGHLWFLAGNEGRHDRLWRSDGTRAGTALVVDLPGDDYIDRLVGFSGRVYFPFDDGEHGEELWSSDGTVGGTRILKDVSPGLGGTWEWQFARSGGRLYFTARDGAHGLELWSTDGTRAGTALARDIRRGSADAFPDDSESAWSTWIEPIDGGVAFMATDGEHGEQMWRSDGTRAGTRQVIPGDSGPSMGWPASVRGDLYFYGSDGTHGAEPWRYRAASGGLRLIRDIRRGAASSLAAQFDSWGWPEMTAVRDRVFFAATDGPTHGLELWVTDGTDARMVKDINTRPR